MPHPALSHVKEINPQMRKPLLERLGHEWLFCDGACGTVLQSMGLQPGELPEIWNLTHPDQVKKLYSGYLQAGSNIFNTNTFGANRLKYPDNLKEIIEAAVHIAQKARTKCGRDADAYIALDIGPTGKLLQPLGDLSFDDAVRIFGEVVRIGSAAGADLVLIETMNDTYEAKAAVLAAKENCDLPVLCTTTYDENGQLLTGAPVEGVVAMLEGLHVDALGVNCSLGPRQMLPIVQRLVRASSTPVIVNPNAGLPRSENGRTVYDVTPEVFTQYMSEIADLGIQVAGGCCGTTPAHICQMIDCISKKPFRPITPKDRTLVTSYSQVVEIGKRPVIIGERINPTGKKKFKAALLQNDMDYILREGLKEEDQGAEILDVNVGLPEIDEPAMMLEAVTQLQSVTGLPLQIDTSDPAALENALRHYNGKAMINSVNGKRENLSQILPIVRKYGGVLVGLTLDEGGIPTDAEGRVRIAHKIYDAAASYGIPKKDIVIDALAMTISSDTSAALATLETLRRVKDELSGHTILGVSNISFGLPARELINSAFLTMALQNGLSCAIMNPGNEAMMRAFRSACALLDMDPQCMQFIQAYKDYKAAPAAGPAAAGALSGSGTSATGASAGNDTVSLQGTTAGNHSASASGTASGIASPAGISASSDAGRAAENALSAAIVRGMKSDAAAACREALQTRDGMDIINKDLIPALDIVGQEFEKKTLFLPQLLMSADAASAAFEIIRGTMSGRPQKIKAKVIVATVRGDIHDIGKNIVKVLLQNYGYEVIDLGKDVAPEEIVQTAIDQNVPLVGLSALMTTTVPSMAETIRQLRARKPDTKVMVGGAVMTQEYADQIGADFYGKDAMASVRYADSLFS